MKKYEVKVTYDLSTVIFVEAPNDAAAKSRAKEVLEDRYGRRPVVARKTKRTFSNVVAGSVSLVAGFRQVDITADTKEIMIVYAADGDAAKTIAESQLAKTYKEQTPQISTATDIEAQSAKLISLF